MFIHNDQSFSILILASKNNIRSLYFNSNPARVTYAVTYAVQTRPEGVALYLPVRINLIIKKAAMPATAITVLVVRILGRFIAVT